MKKLLFVTCCLIIILSIAVCKIIYNSQNVKPTSTINQSIKPPYKRLVVLPEYTVIKFNQGLESRNYRLAWENLTGKIAADYNNHFKFFAIMLTENPTFYGQEEIAIEPSIKKGELYSS